MKKIFPLIAVLLFTIFALTSQAKAFSADFSAEDISPEKREENLARTTNLVKKIEAYMQNNNAFVGVLARRGAGNFDTGISDTDNLDLTGMAHAGFIVKNGFAKDAEYVTFNLVRKKGAKKIGSREYDLSVLKIWGLPQFFIGSFEKDAIVFLPVKKVQLKLWNLLRANGALEIDEQKRYIKDDGGKQMLDAKGNPRYIIDLFIKNGMFTVLHNPEYNLLSDYAEPSTQNCNEHLLKTYIGVRDHYKAGTTGYDVQKMSDSSLKEFRHNIIQAVEKNYIPGKMILSRTKSSFAFTQNIRFGERYKKSPSLFGLKLKKEHFDVVSVDSFCSEANQRYLGWSDFKVFRESHDPQRGWFIKDLGRDYVKVNRLTGKKNTIAEK
jgi:hypothetical protein